MTERIETLTKLTLAGKMFVNAKETAFDRQDIFLSECERDVKRICEYVLHQEPMITEHQTMTGFFRFNSSVVGTAFSRSGHRHTEALMREFYLKPVDGLSTLEWQHATADYRRVLEVGISGIIGDIDRSLAVHTAPEEREYLFGLRRIAETLIAWCDKCSCRVREFAEGVGDPESRRNLMRLAETVAQTPKNAPRSFYEACLTIYICFSCSLDSLGTLDRYLSRFYFDDLAAGRMTRDEAKEYLQELFLMLQAATPVTSCNFTRGAESHFCIGGYLPDGRDAYNDLSALILEALTDLPTYIPQITLRWTKTQPKEALRFAMDLERNDKNKRIAFQNDEKRIRAYTEICGFKYEDAVNYTTVGCNEPAFPGGIVGATSKMNLLRSVERTFHEFGEEIKGCGSFDEFYGICMRELFADIDKHVEFDNRCNAVRARDVSYVSALFFNGCIEKAKSPTRGAGDVVVCSPMACGMTNVIDSLIVTDQFVYGEKILSMEELIAAVRNNWVGYEDLQTLIRKRGDFFGNDTERSNAIARRFFDSLYAHLLGKKNIFGYPILLGDLIGYNPHHKWFGECTKATPDGRCSGEMLKFGFGQSGGYDREGLTALLNSIAAADRHGIRCGSTVTNVTLDEALIKDDANFEKTVDLFRTYFEKGGVHFQLTYVSKKDLICAKETPDDYKHLRVRVSGFSDYFVKLNEAIQDDIIARTEQK
ncbi:MAG: hypothetical protein IJC19_08185 [Clostridia bacterium]|nr:hypothetical protein [Clostridia bacterium]